MKHYIEQIQKNHENLERESLEHINECSLCKSELKLMQKISKSIKTIPESPVPVSLKISLFNKIYSKPIFTLWQSILVALMLLFSPLIIKFSSRYSHFYLEPVYFYVICIFFAVFATLILIPLTLGIYNKYSLYLDRLDKGIINYLHS